MATIDEAELDFMREQLRKLLVKFDDEYWAARDAAHEFPWDFYNEIAAAGWIGIAIPEEYGGAGKGITEASVLLEEVAASGAAMNGASAIHLSIFGMEPIIKHGGEEMRRNYLPKIATGELHVSFGVTEPDAGTDTTKIKTSAHRDGAVYLVNGRKVWTTKATISDRVLLLVRTTPLAQCSKKTDGMSLLFADLKRPEATISPIPKMGRNAVVSCEVVYENLPVDVADLVGEEGQGFSYLLEGLNAERILLASESIGIGRAALRRAVQYAEDRIVFDRPIGKNQSIAFPLAEARTRLEAAALMVRKAALKFDNGESCGAEANMAKWLAADAAFAAADAAMQTHGGFGYASEFHVERYWREARLMKLAPVSQEMAMNFIAERVLGLPRSY
ncbi:MAG: acyl-CoA dehydrogenase family protein [Pseudomonadota bacterium]